MPALIAAHDDDRRPVLALASKLLEDGGEVRCYLEDPDAELSSIGCKVAIGPLDDSYTLAAALTGAHTFIPFMAGAWADRADEFLSFGLAAAEAAATSKIAQTILPIAVRGSHELQAASSKIQEQFHSNRRPLCIIEVGDGSTETEIVGKIAEADDHESINAVWTVGVRIPL